MESGRKKTSIKEVECVQCLQPQREPYSGPCQHPACKACWAVYLTRDLPDLTKVRCPVCSAKFHFTEIVPDQVAQRRLQKVKNVRCKNCSWKGSVSEYKQDHESVCGNVPRVQCKVLGCGKWLPKNRALELHRTDDWCPMILLMKARLSDAEILHLSMRESWEWTCGLVLRSDIPKVRQYLERLIQVYSHLDPNIPTSLTHDEYGASAQTQDTFTNTSCNNDQSTSSNQRKITDEPDSISTSSAVDSNKITSLCGSTEVDGRPPREPPRGRDYVGAENLSPQEILPAVADPQLRVSSHVRKNGIRTISYEELAAQIQKAIAKTQEEIENNRRRLEDLKNIPRAFAVLQEKTVVLEGVMATLHREVSTLNTRLSDVKLPSEMQDRKITEDLRKESQRFSRDLSSLSEAVRKLEARLENLECSHTGVFLWKIDNYRQRKRSAMTTNVKSIYSSPFFTSQYGYKLCGRVFLMGDGVGKGTHISLFLTIMRGPYDAVLPWPFKEKIIFQLVNQREPSMKSIVEAFRPDPTSSSFKRPTSERNIGAGCPLFAKIQVIEDPNQGFIIDDTLYIKIAAVTSDIAEIK
ncbi:uncharacterized protein [Diadema setosum]|uniref:uncharacterized protein n=1 Tax=Diadema setosum TaxID=31175 RepID=UPI003B3BABD0